MKQSGEHNDFTRCPSGMLRPQNRNDCGGLDFGLRSGDGGESAPLAAGLPAPGRRKFHWRQRSARAKRHPNP